MAKTTDKMPAHGNQRYDWDLWENGQQWEARRGRDFKCSVESFRSMLSNRARARGTSVETRVKGGTVVFQFKPKATAGK